MSEVEVLVLTACGLAALLCSLLATLGHGGRRRTGSDDL